MCALNEVKGMELIMNNEIIGNIKLINAEIKFKGDNNKLFCKGNICLENCNIRFTGSNSLIYIDENLYPMSLNMRVGNDSVIYIGKDCYINRTSHLYATERKNIIIGNQLLLSFNTYFRTADPHIIYDCKTKERLNFSKSILIGDKVWIGQDSLILKGTTIGSGSIIGGHSVVSNKNIKSNTLYAGNPAKKIKENVFYSTPESTHDFTSEQIENSRCFKNDDGEKYVYKKDETNISLTKIDEDLSNMNNVNDKIEYIENSISNNNYKNRFYNE